MSIQQRAFPGFVAKFDEIVKSRHSRENGNLENSNYMKYWIPACAGMTDAGYLRHSGTYYI
jgi:hypothetical protein